MSKALVVIDIQHNNISAGTRTFKLGTKGADAAGCVKSTTYNMTKTGYRWNIR